MMPNQPSPVNQRIFGMETEYAFTARGQDGRVLDRYELLCALLDLAGRRWPHLPACESGIFLQNGSRFYQDPGGHFAHLEMAGPECANPWDVVRYLQAGERQLVGLAADLVQQRPGVAEALFYKTNIDYSGNQTSWGCHESYLARERLPVLARHIIPHLVSRLIFTGAGGFDPFSPGISFLLSPRVAHLFTVADLGTEEHRPIFHTKDERLCRAGYRRLHVVCGESVCSETGAWLKVATTALVVVMIDAGLGPGEAVQLLLPLKAIRQFAMDPDCRATAALANGPPATALQIQRHYLHLAEANLDRPFMPPWAEAACRRWREVLDKLEHGPAALDRVLDWAIKLPLYRARAARLGIRWESLAAWNHFLAGAGYFLGKLGLDNRPITPDLLASLPAEVRQAILRHTPVLEEAGLDWSRLPDLFQLRLELFEIDWRFGQLGAGSPWAALERAGLLAHQVAGVDNIEHAMACPPNFGRARLRGEMIKRLAHLPGRYRCDWQGVFDTESWWAMDLSEPFETEERWLDFSAHRHAPDSSGGRNGLDTLFSLIRDERRRPAQPQ